MYFRLSQSPCSVLSYGVIAFCIIQRREVPQLSGREALHSENGAAIAKALGGVDLSVVVNLVSS